MGVHLFFVAAERIDISVEEFEELMEKEENK